jgi:hypothetical protein
MGFLGFGASPFGSSPYGFGAIPASNSTTAKLLKKPDGTQGNAPLIDTQSRDYVLDDTGQKVGADSTLMMVELALLTVKSSSAVRGFGLDSPGGVFSTDADRQADMRVRAALAHLTKKKLISIQRIALIRENVRAGFIRVDWIDLNTGEAAYNIVQLASSP